MVKSIYVTNMDDYGVSRRTPLVGVGLLSFFHRSNRAAPVALGCFNLHHL